MPAPRHLTTLVLVSAIAASGCGRESEEEKVRAKLDEFASATAKKDYDTICDDVFSAKLVEQVKRTLPCEVALKQSDLGAAKAPKLDIQRIRVDGKRATADVTSSAANQRPSKDTVQLVREAGGWRIIALSSS